LAAVSRAYLWIAGAVAALLVAGGGALLYLRSQSSPQQTLDAYCHAWTTGDAQTMYDETSTAGRRLLSVSELQDQLRGPERPASCSASHVQVQGATATAIVTLPGTSLSATLVRESGEWKVESFGPPPP
jgi:hypothetical protein